MKLFSEAFNSKVPYEVVKHWSDIFKAEAEIPGTGKIVFSASKLQDEAGDEIWEVIFSKSSGFKQTYDKTNDGKAFEVMSFVRDAMLEFISRYQPHRIEFTSDKDDGGSSARTGVYKRMLERLGGGKYKIEIKSRGNKGDVFVLTKI